MKFVNWFVSLFKSKEVIPDSVVKSCWDKNPSCACHIEGVAAEDRGNANPCVYPK